MLGHGIEAIRAHLESLPDMRGASVETLRENYDKAEYVFECPTGVVVDTLTLGGVPSEVLKPAKADGGRTVLYLHGGGYALGSPRSHRHLAAHIADAANATLVIQVQHANNPGVANIRCRGLMVRPVSAMWPNHPGGGLVQG